MHDQKRFISLIIVVLTLTACGSAEVCDKPQPYFYSKAGSELVIPEGLDQPDGTGRLVVPEISDETSPRTGTCLSLPPTIVVAKVKAEEPPPPPDMAVTEVRNDKPLTIGPGFNSESAEQTIAAWAQSWADADIPTYLSFYSKDLEVQDESDSKEQWLRNRSDLLVQTGAADIRVRDVSVENVSTDRRRVRLVQEFRIPTGTQSVVKIIELTREGGGWRILSERVDEVLE